MAESNHILGNFEKALNKLSDDIAVMSSKVENSFELAVRGLVRRDTAYKETAKKLTKRMEENPEHIKDYLDLQFIIRFVERIGDHAKNIAQDTVYTESAMDIHHGGDLPDISR